MIQFKLLTVTIKDSVPTDHFLCKLDGVLNLSFVYQITASLYSKKHGHPPIDPIALVKYLMVGLECQIELRTQTDVALR